jgi:hypothetical protein
MAQRAEDAGESESRLVIGRIGPATTRQEIPNPKGCRLPAGLDGKETYGTSLSPEMLDDEDLLH